MRLHLLAKYRIRALVDILLHLGVGEMRDVSRQERQPLTTLAFREVIIDRQELFRRYSAASECIELSVRQVR
jgi:hypothetical protein